MKQTRLMSLVEAVANVAVGYGVAVVTQILIFPMFGLHTTLAQNLKMGALFTAVSIARSFVLRRLFHRAVVRPAAAVRSDQGLGLGKPGLRDWNTPPNCRLLQSRPRAVRHGSDHVACGHVTQHGG